MRKYHHYGIPTEEKRDDETYIEAGGFSFYSTPFGANEWHIQWHRIPKNHGLPELATKVPHIAFTVDNLDEELKNKKILFGPYSPLEGYRCAMIEECGIPIELIETDLSDEELTELDNKNKNKPNDTIPK